MEQFNKIEIRGLVGNSRVQSVGDTEYVRFSVATNYAYKGRDGVAVIETTWINVIAWGGKGMPDFRQIEKGSPVYVTGRLRSQRYKGADDVERTTYEVQAYRVEILNPDGQMQPAQ